jgi:hypothetical protein
MLIDGIVVSTTAGTAYFRCLADFLILPYVPDPLCPATRVLRSSGHLSLDRTWRGHQSESAASAPQSHVSTHFVSKSTLANPPPQFLSKSAPRA